MSIGNEILGETFGGSHCDPLICDKARQKHLLELSDFTGRNTILFASSWLQRDDAPPSKIAIADQDLCAIKEVASDFRGPELDIILHSPGGSPVAAEAIVCYLRARFSDIRVIVPNFAKSAATMIACSANRIVMGKYSFLGPADPRFPLVTPLGPRLASAQATLDQYKLIREAIGEEAESLCLSPLLPLVGADLIEACRSAVELSRRLVRSWLRDYMFADVEQRESLAEEISNWLTDRSYFIDYNRHLSQSDLARKGLFIDSLEADQSVQDLILSVFYATTRMFSAFKVAKIIESHCGKSVVTTFKDEEMRVESDFDLSFS